MDVVGNKGTAMYDIIRPPIESELKPIYEPIFYTLLYNQ